MVSMVTSNGDSREKVSLLDKERTGRAGRGP